MATDTETLQRRFEAETGLDIVTFQPFSTATFWIAFPDDGEGGSTSGNGHGEGTTRDAAIRDFIVNCGGWHGFDAEVAQ